MSLQRGVSSRDLSQYLDWSALPAAESQPVSQDWSHLLRAPPTAESDLETQKYEAPAEDELETQKYEAPAESDLETQKYGAPAESDLETQKYDLQKVLNDWQTKYWSRCKNDKTGAKAVLKKVEKKSWKNGVLKKAPKKVLEKDDTHWPTPP